MLRRRQRTKSEATRGIADALLARESTTKKPAAQLLRGGRS
jgi:hypothetical protein